MNNSKLYTYATENSEAQRDINTFFNPLSAQVIEGVPKHIHDTDKELGFVVIMSGN